ncbi:MULTISPECIES: hypothetical protein [unclassified Mesorhizobium]|nr:hypothetical protein [Mesorhizobium sp.]
MIARIVAGHPLSQICCLGPTDPCRSKPWPENSGYQKARFRRT